MRRALTFLISISLLSTSLLWTLPTASAEEVPQLSAKPEVSVPEIANDLAISNSGIVLASFADLQQVGIIGLDGSVRKVDLGCPPTDVTIMPDARYGAAVCLDSSSIFIVDIASASIVTADLQLIQPIRVTYLPSTQRMVIFGLSGQIVLVSAQDLNDFGVIKSFTVDLYLEVMAVSTDGRYGYVPAAGGRILKVEFETGTRTLTPRGNPNVTIVAMVPAAEKELLYAVAVEKVGEGYQTSITTIDPEEGTHSNRVDLVVPGFVNGPTTIAANSRVLFVASGVGAVLDSKLYGLFGLGIDAESVLRSFTPLVGEGFFAGAFAVSADGTQLAVGTTNSQLLRYSTTNVPYRTPVVPIMAEEKSPASLVVTVRAFSKRGTIRVLGKSSGYAPGTQVAIYLKERSKEKTTFTAQKVLARIGENGDFTWRGKSKAKRVTLYAFSPSDEVKSNVVIAARR